MEVISNTFYEGNIYYEPEVENTWVIVLYNYRWALFWSSYTCVIETE